MVGVLVAVVHHLRHYILKLLEIYLSVAVLVHLPHHFHEELVAVRAVHHCQHAADLLERYGARHVQVEGVESGAQSVPVQQLVLVHGGRAPLDELNLIVVVHVDHAEDAVDFFFGLRCSEQP